MKLCRLFPRQDVLTRLLQPISEVIAEVQQFREKNRSSQLFNHLSTVSESVPALGWVAIVSWEEFCVCLCVCFECVGRQMSFIKAGHKPLFEICHRCLVNNSFLAGTGNRAPLLVWMINSLFDVVFDLHE